MSKENFLLGVYSPELLFLDLCECPVIPICIAMHSTTKWEGILPLSLLSRWREEEGLEVDEYMVWSNINATALLNNE